MTMKSSNPFLNIKLVSSITLSTNFKKLHASKIAQKTINNPTNQYRTIKVIGQGCFGVVYAASTCEGETVAIKKVLQDPRYLNRELEIMQQLNNEYCVNLRNYFVTPGRNSKETYLNLVMDYLPISLHQFDMNYRRDRKYPPILYVKLFSFEMFSGLNYLHSLGITHRDLKPHNILCDPASGALKICDFGTAKKIRPGEKSTTYISPRFYRAPELIFEYTQYSTPIDIWSAGCIIAEMLMAGMPLFQGQSSYSQLEEICKIIGSPTENDMQSFRHSHKIPVPTISMQAPLDQVLPKQTPPEFIDLLSKIFVFNPSKRLTAFECMQHPVFDCLFNSNLLMPDKRPFPVLNRNPQY